MYFRHIPVLIQRCFPQLMWKREATNQVFLTFDDGPHPMITEYVLKVLQAYKVKASFFVIGKNVNLSPETLRATALEGHTIGNHTQHHLNGWKTPLTDYLEDVQKCQESLEDVLGFSPIYFRPPYGKMTFPQMRNVRQSYEIVMMDMLCGDFDLKATSTDCTDTIKKHCKSGSIIVYHDSEKAFPRLKDSLPAVLDFFLEQDIQPVALPPTPNQHNNLK